MRRSLGGRPSPVVQLTRGRLLGDRRLKSPLSARMAQSAGADSTNDAVHLAEIGGCLLREEAHEAGDDHLRHLFLNIMAALDCFVSDDVGGELPPNLEEFATSIGRLPFCAPEQQ